MLPSVFAKRDRPIVVRVMHDGALDRDPMAEAPGRPADDDGARGARQSRARQNRMPAARRLRPCAPGQRFEHRDNLAHIKAVLCRGRKGARYVAVLATGEHRDDRDAAIRFVELSNMAHACEVRKCEAESQRLPR